MNIFHKVKEDLNKIIGKNYPENDISQLNITVESPRDYSFGDISTNVAMTLGAKLRQSPRVVAEKLMEEMSKIPYIQKLEIAGAGFLNITINAREWARQLAELIALGEAYGTSMLTTSSGSVNIEFVSANPTGPMHIGHARGTVYGNALANLLKATGNKVTKEYYINDYGNQINTLAESLYLRYLEVKLGKPAIIPEGLYPGTYLIPIAEELFKLYGDKLGKDQESFSLIKEFALKHIMEMIKADLKELGVEHDVFSSEKELNESGKILKAVKILEDKGLIYKGEIEAPKGMVHENWSRGEQLLFKSTLFGDDQDRPIQKANGEWAYLAGDIAYALDKIERGFTTFIIVLGADHGGYIKRLEAIFKALGGEDTKIIIKICQLVNYLEGGQPVKMSKRAGTFTTVKDVIAEIGKDIVTFVNLTRKNDAVLDFDLEKVKEQSKDNPVFYVQYAYVRANSVFEKASSMIPQINSYVQASDLTLLNTEEELRFIKNLISFPKTIEQAASHYEPHRITYYLINLASEFHSLWNLGKDNEYYRFINPDNLELTYARLALLRAMQIVIKSGLKILGVETVEKM